MNENLNKTLVIEAQNLSVTCRMLTAAKDGSAKGSFAEAIRRLCERIAGIMENIHKTVI